MDAYFVAVSGGYAYVTTYTNDTFAVVDIQGSN